MLIAQPLIMAGYGWSAVCSSLDAFAEKVFPTTPIGSASFLNPRSPCLSPDRPSQQQLFPPTHPNSPRHRFPMIAPRRPAVVEFENSTKGFLLRGKSILHPSLSNSGRGIIKFWCRLNSNRTLCPTLLSPPPESFLVLPEISSRLAFIIYPSNLLCSSSAAIPV
ncbi:hypothetical protein BT69DRAFT_368044 [Atractiella rhizophila]|nr:hypothetical protein BT69DRAFT_368044 [Atractiella rhizophila]